LIFNRWGCLDLRGIPKKLLRSNFFDEGIFCFRSGYERLNFEIENSFDFADECFDDRVIKNAPKGTSFEDVLKTDPELKKVLSEQDVAFVLNPKNYLGQAKWLVNDCVTKVKRQNK
jgi:predicted aldo/keto reductase-like oxidoreductase